MTDDPRIAALAEALHANGGARCPRTEPHGAHANQHMEDAAAILAALPPDWCGHEAELDGWLQVVNLAGEQMLEMEAEIARLREALETHHRVLLDFRIGTCPVCRLPGALEKKP